MARKNISRFNVETAGHLDPDVELQIRISSDVQPGITREFNKQVGFHDLQAIPAQQVLG